MRLVEATKPDGPRTDACPRQEIERDAVDNPDHVNGAHDSEVIVIRGEAKLMIASGE